MSVAIRPVDTFQQYGQTRSLNYTSGLPSPAKKPKLSLNTSGVTSLLARGASVAFQDALSATSSPTTRNTYSNVNSSIPITATATPERTPSPVPYELAADTVSILVNGPRRSSASSTASNSASSPPKKVAFRAPLVEIIERAAQNDSIDGDSLSAIESAVDFRPSPIASRSLLQARDMADSAVDEDEDSDDELAMSSTTPSTHRLKRRRIWTWTIDPSTIANESSHEPADTQPGIGASSADAS